ncbi:MAG: hypothetical protein EOO72_00385 [Myxococcaceae bacterium]|nr:MAG: hypothetical protein EOO72_00385 [Myxococcaceae bacterium]
MRLFLMAVLCGSVLAGCKKDDSKAGALNVTIGYSGFTRGCVTVTATDVDDDKNTNSTNVEVTDTTPGKVSVAVFREKDWGRVLDVTAQVHELNCSGPVVATDTARGQVPEEGKQDLTLAVSANDKDTDGYFDFASGGSDCDDANVNVNPGAAIDGRKDFYPDNDGDTFGDMKVTTPTRACEAPDGYVEDNSDCNDASALIHPATTEQFCDGEDDNCSGVPDETFQLGQSCISSEPFCGPTYRCSPDKLSKVCFSETSATPWFVDVDGDLKEGADAGISCTRPVPNAVETSSDCDESSRFVANGINEVCDRLDNNCMGGVDEGCPTTFAWTDAGMAGVGTTDLTSVGLYDEGRKGWVVGPNKLVHFDSTAGTSREFTDSSCKKDWTAVWVAQDGRVFVAAHGVLSTQVFQEADEPCFTLNVPTSPDFNDITGVDAPTGATTYAVAGNGKIYRWVPPYGGPENPPDNPGPMITVAANLRAVSAAKSGDLLLAVGANSAGNSARVFQFNPTQSGSNWSSETLGATDAGFLRGVHVLSSHYAYAVGDNGYAFERTGSDQWRALARVNVANERTTPTNVLDVLAFSKNGVYGVTSDNTIEFFNGESWKTVHPSPQTLKSLDGLLPTQIRAVGDEGTIVNFTAPPLP